MHLNELPAEIISRICRFLGLIIRKHVFPSLVLAYNNHDFDSLRKTCKELRHKTEYDATVRYRKRFSTRTVPLDYQSCDKFLNVIKVPIFRDMIQTIRFKLRDQYNDPYDFRDNPDDEDGAPGRTIPRIRTRMFLESDEASEILADCFRNLEMARRLQRIELLDNFGHDLILRSMELANFSRKLAYLPIEPEHLLRWGYDKLQQTPKTFSPYIKGLIMQPLLPDPCDTEPPAAGQAVNPLGLHIKDYRPTKPSFTELMSAFIDVEEIQLYGCCSNPALRFCHGCDDLFAQNFAPTRYHSLSRLAIQRIFISGGRLRRFIKRHADTLNKLEVSYVSLTDGSWQSIAQGLAKLRYLGELKLSRLTQKHAIRNVDRPKEYCNDFELNLRSRDDVQHFLEVFITYFSTVLYLNSDRVRGSPPKYHQVKLFRLPEKAIEESLSEEAAALWKYAEIGGFK
ncbi:hypothetical protein HBH98_197910 [Parastagonospora nodorum]|nr:hypothetical protein HBH98_197910 [Parastagonospora nodorum]KAH4364232.1 hypothetical protein HBH97_181300 [Parastagonospora nodorum]KAH4383998.1 hypothetical protein HBH99_181150 [Parastagonospora nodorum]